MSQILDVVASFLDQEEFDYRRHDEKGLVRTGITSDSNSYEIFLLGNDDRLSVVVRQGTKVPEKQRRSVAELFSRINFKMKYGHFDLDFDDGEVRYDITIPVETTGVSIQTVKLVFHSALSAMHHHFPALMAVAFGAQSPEQALAALEADRKAVDDESDATLADTVADNRLNPTASSTSIH